MRQQYSSGFDQNF